MKSTTTQHKNIVRADEVIGVNVVNGNKEKLGKIYQIVLDKTSGQVKYLVLESGSFLGLGGKFFALPWNSVHYSLEDEAFLLNVHKDNLKNAPGFDKDDWPEFSNDKWIKLVSNYYAQV